VVTARWLPIWQWDSLAYHLPFVNFFLMARGPSAVPADLPFLATYPHNIELFTTALRAALPDDRLIDFAQVPLALMGAMATGAMARLHGAERSHAVAAGCAWLLVPAMFLQLPTNYIDVSSAALLLTAIYFVLAAPTARTLLVGGVALGLYLGSKVNAPVGAALLGLLLLVRGLRAKLRAPTFAALIIAFALGAGAPLSNLIEHGNPLWPVKVKAGPLHFPGTMSMNEILAAGTIPARAHLSLPWKLLTSWFDLTSRPSFDMRVGGYGPLFVVALPFALLTLIQKRSAPLWAAVAVTLATPDPSVARFAPAFPAIVFALAAPHVSRVKPGLRVYAFGIAALLGVVQLAYAWPGLTGDGPPLLAYASMSDEERIGAVGGDGPATERIEARKRVRDGETFAFDRAIDFAYLAWEPDLRYRVVWIPNDLKPDEVGDFLARENVRVFSVGDDTPGGLWVRSHPNDVVRLCPCSLSGPCSVYQRR